MTGSASPLELLLVSDFGVTNLAALLRSRAEDLSLACQVAPFGDVGGAILAEEREPEARRGVLVWTRPEAVLPGFAEILSGSGSDPASLMDQVDRYVDLLAEASRRFRFVLAASWTAPPGHRGLGMLDLDPDRGVAGSLLRANLRLAEAVEELDGVHLLDAAPWVAASDAEEAARLWYLAKMPYARGTLERAADQVAAALRGLLGLARKLVVVDLDDTLWGGILGDAGWEGLRLGGHDPVGEAYVDFQKALRSLTHRGVILAVVSKNEESLALEAMRKHPEMILRPDDLAGWRINWTDKARNVAELVEELNLGVQSVVFLDDNPSERGRVREALPGVLVPDWPDDPLRYAARLRAMTCFDQPTLSTEDRERARMYVAERKRREARTEVGSMEDWLASLEVTVEVEPLSDANLPRATQLLNKTNQMNLATRRMTEPEFKAWAEAEGHQVWTVRVSDRFGDYGLTGIVSLAPATASGGPGTVMAIADFVLSCRVFGRKVEEAMVHVAATAARNAGASTIEATLLPTPKNEPCRAFWTERSGFEFEESSNRFERDLGEPYPAPEIIRLLQAPAGTPPR